MPVITYYEKNAKPARALRGKSVWTQGRDFFVPEQKVTVKLPSSSYIEITPCYNGVIVKFISDANKTQVIEPQMGNVWRLIEVPYTATRPRRGLQE